MISHEELHRVIQYDPETGHFTWRVKTARCTLAGHRAGGQSGIYRKVRIYHEVYLEHRLAYFWMIGEWPPEYIDHANRDPLDNRWANLRPATNSQNMANSCRSSNNTSGFKGVFFDPETKMWRARIRLNRKRKSLGFYKTPEDAHAAYAKAQADFYGEFARAA